MLGAVQAGNAATLALTVNGDLTLGNTTAATLSAGTVVLDAAGDITEPNGTITATLLTGPSTGLAYTSANSATLDSATNSIATLGSFTTSGDFTLNDVADLTITGALVSGGNILLTANALNIPGTIAATGGGTVTTITSGTISETGTLIAGTLTGSASAASFAGTNNVGTLDGFTTSGDFALNDNEALTVLGAVQTGNAATLALTVNGDLTLGNTTAATLSAGTVVLDAAGDITEPNGTITATLLTGPSTGLIYTRANSAKLDSATNSIATLGSFTTSGDFTLNDVADLTITGALQSGGNILLTANALNIPGTIAATNGGTVTTITSGTISETGTLIAGTLTGSASAASFAGTNNVGTLDGFTTSGDFALNDNEALTVLGAVQTGNAATLALTVNGDLTLGNTTAATLSAGTVVLDAAGDITEPNGTITATLLTGPSTGLIYTSANSAKLDSATNSIATLGSFATSGDFELLDNRSLTVLGRVAAGSTSTLSMAANGDLAIGQIGTAGILSAGIVQLDAPGAITEQNGTIIATTLIGPSASLIYTTPTPPRWTAPPIPSPRWAASPHPAISPSPTSPT